MAEALYNNLSVTKKLPKKIPHILVDDVLTTGGHLKASATTLREQGVQIKLAVCAGRTVHVAPPDPFAVLVEVVDDYEP